MKNAFLILALLALYAAAAWLDADAAYKAEVVAHVNRQQAIDAVRALNCGESPFYLAQSPGDF